MPDQSGCESLPPESPGPIPATMRVALLCHTQDGGVWSATRWLYGVLENSGRYKPEIFLLATSRRDTASSRILAPRTWTKPPQLLRERLGPYSYMHVGCVMAEVEFQRYRERRMLTGLLNQFDLVQVISGSPAWAGVASKTRRPVALQVATLAGVERVSQMRSMHLPRRLWPSLMTAITSWLDNRNLDIPSVVFVENQWMQDYVSGKIGAERVVFAPLGVNTEKWQAADYRTDGYILSVSRLSDPRKNVRMLIEAYSRVCQSFPDAPDLILAGKTGPRPADLEYASALGLELRIRVIVEVPDDQLRELYQGAALFVLSSDEEGQGLVLLEAMACGLPVVSTNCGGPATCVVPGETGLLTPVRDAQALAEAIIGLLEQPHLRAAMGQAGRLRVEENFSQKAAGDVFLTHYDRLVAQSLSEKR